MADITLKANKREVLGKKTRFLRRQGQTPAHLFGHGVESLALQCDTAELQRVISKKGTTRLMDIKVGSEKTPRSVFIREIQRDALSGQLIHVDLYQVNKAEKIKVAIPIVLVGESPALKQKNNIIEQLINQLEVESLPGDLPPQIEIDLSGLIEVNQAIHVSDVVLKSGVTISAPPELLIVKVSQVAEEKEEVVAEAVVQPEAEAAVTAEEAPKGETETKAKAEKKE